MLKALQLEVDDEGCIIDASVFEHIKMLRAEKGDQN